MKTKKEKVIWTCEECNKPTAECLCQENHVVPAPASSHTPTPWNPNDLQDLLFKNPELGRANANLIVRAVNSHEELLRLVKSYRSFLLSIADPMRISEYELIDKAIAKAEGK